MARPGFTLLEVLIVLAVTAGLATLVLPNASRLYEGGVLALGRGDVERQVARLPLAAALQGGDITLDRVPGNPDVPVRLEPGWRLAADPPITYRHDGVCSGGHLVLWRGDARADYELEAPFCRLRRVEAQ